MIIKEITAKSLLRKHRQVDSWFIASYGMNLYRGCTHDCSYCDGRAEKYQVEGEFGSEVGVKVNAIDLLKKELDPSRKRKPMKKSFIMLGGGVGDAYQAPEEKYKMARQVLEVLRDRHWPVHILTKSVMVERDLDLLKEIDKQTRALVSFSFSTVDTKIASVFEPGVPEPSSRLDLIKRLNRAGISCGMFLLPVIPFISDTPQKLDETFRAAREAGVAFINFGGMTLKPGRQREHYYRVLKEHYPDKLIHYHNIYKKDKWGAASGSYYGMLDRIVIDLSRKHRIPLRVPDTIFGNIVDDNDRVAVILSQLDYMLKLDRKKSPYGFAAYKINQLKEPLSDMFGILRQIKGVGQTTERIVKEILRTGTSAYYKKVVLYQ